MKILIFLSSLIIPLCFSFQIQAKNINETGKSIGKISDIDINNLYQSWTHSFEEEKDNIKIFRPANNREFPPARFRMAYVFYENGDCLWMYLHPADAHSMKPGKWKLQSKDIAIIAISDSTGKKIDEFGIVELKKDLLRIIKAP